MPTSQNVQAQDQFKQTKVEHEIIYIGLGGG